MNRQYLLEVAFWLVGGAVVFGLTYLFHSLGWYAY